MSTQAQINSALPDNTTKLITPQILRTVLQLLTYLNDIHEGALTSSGPSDAEIRAIVGTPTVNSNFVLADTSGTKFLFLVHYDVSDDSFWYERLTKAL